MGLFKSLITLQLFGVRSEIISNSYRVSPTVPQWWTAKISACTTMLEPRLPRRIRIQRIARPWRSWSGSSPQTQADLPVSCFVQNHSWTWRELSRHHAGCVSPLREVAIRQISPRLLALSVIFRTKKILANCPSAIRPTMKFTSSSSLSGLPLRCSVETELKAEVKDWPLFRF